MAIILSSGIWGTKEDRRLPWASVGETPARLSWGHQGRLRGPRGRRLVASPCCPFLSGPGGLGTEAVGRFAVSTERQVKSAEEL